MNTLFKYAMVSLLAVLCLLISFGGSAMASNNVVVIPLFSDGEESNYKRIITVGPTGADFADPSAALAALAGETTSLENRILIKIAQGTYTINSPLKMKEYVDIQGAAVDKTILAGAISESFNHEQSAIILGADHSGLSDLSVQNNGDDCLTIGLHNNNASPTIKRVKLTATGGASCGEFLVATGIDNSGAETFAKLEEVESGGFIAPGFIGFGYGLSNRGGAILSMIKGRLDGDTFSINNSDGSPEPIVVIEESVLLNKPKNGGTLRCISSTNQIGNKLDVDCT